MTEHLINKKQMPRTEEQFKKMRDKTRAAIIDAALKLFANKGYHGTSIAEIAKEAGISKGLAYNYFNSKQDLVEAVIELLENFVAGLFSEAEKLSDPYEKLALFVEVTLDNIKENKEFWSLYFGLSLQKDVLKISNKVLGGNIEEIFALLESLFKEIGIKDPESEARIFGAILDGIGVHYLYNSENYPMEKVKKQILENYSKEKLTQTKL